MFDLFASIFLFATLLNLLSSGILFVRVRTRDINPSNLYLAGFFLCVFTYGVVSYIFETPQTRTPFWIALVYGHLAPLWYLLGPFTFFYVRSTLTDQVRLKPFDAVHFIPFFLQLVNLTPYFFWPFSEKLALAQQMLQNVDVVTNSGIGLFIPVFVNYLARPILAMAYAIGSFRFVWRHIPSRHTELRGMERVEGHTALPGLRNWFTFFLATQILMYGMYLSIFVLDAFSSLELRFLLDGTPLLFLSGMAFAFLSVIPHFYPHIIYGFEPMKRELGVGSEGKTSQLTSASVAEIRQREATEGETTKARVAGSNVTGMGAVGGGLGQTDTLRQRADNGSKARESTMDVPESRLLEMDSALRDYLNKTEAYCEPDFSLKSLSVGVGIPAYQINYYLRYFLNMRFIEFRMNLRMQKAKLLLESEEATVLTIQGIAQQCGYSHRSTFAEHFKKVHGITPSEVIKVQVQEP